MVVGDFLADGFGVEEGAAFLAVDFLAVDTEDDALVADVLDDVLADVLIPEDEDVSLLLHKLEKVEK